MGNPYGHIGGLKVGHFLGNPFIKGGQFTVLAPNPNADDSDGEMSGDGNLVAAPQSFGTGQSFDWGPTVWMEIFL